MKTTTDGRTDGRTLLPFLHLRSLSPSSSASVRPSVRPSGPSSRWSWRSLVRRLRRRNHSLNRLRQPQLASAADADARRWTATAHARRWIRSSERQARETGCPNPFSSTQRVIAGKIYLIIANYQILSSCCCCCCVGDSSRKAEEGLICRVARSIHLFIYVTRRLNDVLFQTAFRVSRDSRRRLNSCATDERRPCAAVCALSDRAATA